MGSKSYTPNLNLLLSTGLLFGLQILWVFSFVFEEGYRRYPLSLFSKRPSIGEGYRSSRRFEKNTEGIIGISSLIKFKPL